MAIKAKCYVVRCLQSCDLYLVRCCEVHTCVHELMVWALLLAAVSVVVG
jgi:hypothetical protein